MHQLLCYGSAQETACRNKRLNRYAKYGHLWRANQNLQFCRHEPRHLTHRSFPYHCQSETNEFCRSEKIACQRVNKPKRCYLHAAGLRLSWVSCHQRPRCLTPLQSLRRMPEFFPVLRSLKSPIYQYPCCQSCKNTRVKRRVLRLAVRLAVAMCQHVLNWYLNLPLKPFEWRLLSFQLLIFKGKY